MAMKDDACIHGNVNSFFIKPVKMQSEDVKIIQEKIQINHADLPDAVPLLPKQTNYQ